MNVKPRFRARSGDADLGAINVQHTLKTKELSSSLLARVQRNKEMRGSNCSLTILPTLKRRVQEEGRVTKGAKQVWLEIEEKRTLARIVKGGKAMHKLLSEGWDLLPRKELNSQSETLRIEKMSSQGHSYLPVWVTAQYHLETGWCHLPSSCLELQKVSKYHLLYLFCIKAGKQWNPYPKNSLSPQRSAQSRAVGITLCRIASCLHYSY